MFQYFNIKQNVCSIIEMIDSLIWVQNVWSEVWFIGLYKNQKEFATASNCVDTYQDEYAHQRESQNIRNNFLREKESKVNLVLFTSV